jgi:hypothetical protein
VLLKQNALDCITYQQQKLIPHSFRAGKSKSKVSAGEISDKCPLPGLQMTASGLSSHGGWSDELP